MASLTPRQFAKHAQPIGVRVVLLANPVRHVRFDFNAPHQRLDRGSAAPCDYPRTASQIFTKRYPVLAARMCSNASRLTMCPLGGHSVASWANSARWKDDGFAISSPRIELNAERIPPLTASNWKPARLTVITPCHCVPTLPRELIAPARVLRDENRKSARFENTRSLIADVDSIPRHQNVAVTRRLRDAIHDRVTEALQSFAEERLLLITEIEPRPFHLLSDALTARCAS